MMNQEPDDFGGPHSFDGDGAMPEAATTDFEGNRDATREIVVSMVEFPQFYAAKDGAPFTLKASGRIVGNQGSFITLALDRMEFETEGPADKELKRMTGGGEYAQTEAEGESDF